MEDEMTTETILMDDQVRNIIEDVASPNEEVFKFTVEVARAIEQAVMQSEQVRALRRDAARYRATRAGLVGTDPGYGDRFCAYCDAEGIEQAVEITEDQFDADTDAAMEKQK